MGKAKGGGGRSVRHKGLGGLMTVCGIDLARRAVPATEDDGRVECAACLRRMVAAGKAERAALAARVGDLEADLAHLDALEVRHAGERRVLARDAAAWRSRAAALADIAGGSAALLRGVVGSEALEAERAGNLAGT